MGEIIEGNWDDLTGRQDLQGRRVRVVVLDEGEKGGEDPWLRALGDWMDRHEALGSPADDSRESIYSGTLDDPR